MAICHRGSYLVVATGCLADLAAALLVWPAGMVVALKVNGEVWLPSRQDFVAQGRELIKGFRIHQVTEFAFIMHWP